MGVIFSEFFFLVYIVGNYNGQKCLKAALLKSSWTVAFLLWLVWTCTSHRWHHETFLGKWQLVSAEDQTRETISQGIVWQAICQGQFDRLQQSSLDQFVSLICLFCLLLSSVLCRSKSGRVLLLLLLFSCFYYLFPLMSKFSEQKLCHYKVFQLQREKNQSACSPPMCLNTLFSPCPW